MLDAHVPPVARMPGIGDVAGGVDRRDIGLEVLVGDDPVVDGQPAPGARDVGPGSHADSGDDQVGRLGGAIGEDDLLHAP